MQETLLSLLTAWHTFYSIVGSAAATLMGLVFVVISLIAGLRTRVPSSGSGIAVFGTPNVVHFGTVLLVAAMLSAPWPVFWPIGLLLGLAGLGGIAYIIVVLWRAYHLGRNYQLVLEDWVWHITLPFVSYTALIVAALVLLTYPTPALFLIAAATVLFLFIGIHNAWDSVTFTTLMLSHNQNKSQDEQESSVTL